MSKLYKKFMIFNRDENSQQITAVRQIYANFMTQRIHDFRLALFIVSDVTPCSTNQTTGNVQTSLDSSDFKYPTSNISFRLLCTFLHTILYKITCTSSSADKTEIYHESALDRLSKIFSRICHCQFSVLI